MPAGCEYICKNESCEHYDKGFNMASPWPMGNIALVMNAPNVKKNIEFRKGLIKLKNAGRKYACITYPNVADIKTEAYRVHLWSSSANCLWQYDVPAKEDIPLDELIEKASLPKVCEKTGGELWTFDQTTKQNIRCPHCNQYMQQSRWFSNED